MQFTKKNRKMWENRDIKIRIEAENKYLMSEPNYNTTKTFYEGLLAMEIKRLRILMSNSVYLGISVLEISKIVICEFWYNYMKPKY